MDRYASSTVNIAKSARQVSAQELARADLASRREKAAPRKYVRSAANGAKVAAEKARQRAAKAAPKYTHDSEAYKRRESPMAAVDIAMKSGLVDGIKVN